MYLYGFAGDGTASIADGNLISDLIGSFTIVNGDLDYNAALDTSIFQNLVDSGVDYAGIVMVSSDETTGFGPGADICAFDSTCSMCAGTSGSTLFIDYDPVAAAALMVLGLMRIGLVGVGAATARRKKLN